MNTYIVIGASAAGISAVTKLRQLDAHAQILCFSDEPECPYNKCFLAEYLAGDRSLQQVYLKPQPFFKEKNIQLHLNTKIVSIDRHAQTVTTENGNTYSYTKLLLATGGSVSLPAIKGIHTTGAFPFYNLPDVSAIMAYAQLPTTKHVVIIGAGMSGLECADALLNHDVQITIIDRCKTVLSRQSDETGSQLIQKTMREYGVSFLPNQCVEEVVSKDGCVSEIKLSGGVSLCAEAVVCALGPRPNIELAVQAELTIEACAVLTNEYLQSSDPNIFVAGDLALVQDLVHDRFIKSCTWPDAVLQGSIAAQNMVNLEKKYAGVCIVSSTSFFGLKFYTCGIVQDYGHDYKIWSMNDDRGYRKILTENNIIKGFLLIGETKSLAELKRATILQEIIDPESFLNQ